MDWLYVYIFYGFINTLTTFLLKGQNKDYTAHRFEEAIINT